MALKMPRRRQKTVVNDANNELFHDFLRVPSIPSSIWFLNSKEKREKKFYRMQFDRKSCCADSEKKSLLNVCDARHLADPIVRGDGEKAGQNDADAVARGDKTHGKLSPRRGNFSTHAVVSVHVGKASLKAFDENHDKHDGDARREQVDCFDEKIAGDEALHDCHDPSVLDLKQVDRRARDKDAYLVCDLVPAVLLQR
jgi:hypothetical protein